MKKPRIMHPNHLSPDELKEFNEAFDAGINDAAIEWLRDNYYMSENQAKAFIKDAGKS